VGLLRKYWQFLVGTPIGNGNTCDSELRQYIDRLIKLIIHYEVCAYVRIYLRRKKERKQFEIDHNGLHSA
jgi:hypothetical protein